MTAYASTWHPSYYDGFGDLNADGTSSVGGGLAAAVGLDSSHANTAAAAAIGTAAAAVLLMDMDSGGGGGGDVDWWW